MYSKDMAGMGSLGMYSKDMAGMGSLGMYNTRVGSL